MISLPLTIYGTTSLGALITALEAVDATKTVQFDFCYTAPTTLDSYRGCYDHLALGWTDAKTPSFDGTYWPTVAALLDVLRSGVGATYEGWKGGHYMMHRSTPLWVANPGQTGSTGIIGVHDAYSIVLVTQWVE